MIHFKYVAFQYFYKKSAFKEKIVFFFQNTERMSLGKIEIKYTIKYIHKKFILNA